MKVVNIFTDCVDRFGINLYPDAGSEVYYVDPIDRNHYIAVDKYFDYVKLARIGELERIAQDPKSDVVAEMHCAGCDPIEPKLEYFRNDPAVVNLIGLRMAHNTLTKQRIIFKCSNSSGIKKKKVAKIYIYK